MSLGAGAGGGVGVKVDFDTFRNPYDGRQTQCIAYGRDRGETKQEAKTFKTLGRYQSYAQQEYAYLFENGIWTVTDHEGVKNLVDLLVE